MKSLDDFILNAALILFLILITIYGTDNIKRLGKILERHCE
jgi:hypothetical protein